MRKAWGAVDSPKEWPWGHVGRDAGTTVPVLASLWTWVPAPAKSWTKSNPARPFGCSDVTASASSSSATLCCLDACLPHAKSQQVTASHSKSSSVSLRPSPTLAGRHRVRRVRRVSPASVWPGPLQVLVPRTSLLRHLPDLCTLVVLHRNCDRNLYSLRCLPANAPGCHLRTTKTTLLPGIPSLAPTKKPPSSTTTTFASITLYLPTPPNRPTRRLTATLSSFLFALLLEYLAIHCCQWEPALIGL